MTHATSPLIGGLFDSDNVIDIYLGVASVNLLDVFRGGIYTDKNQDFFATIAGADYNFWILGDGNGTATTFNSQGYYSLGDFGATLIVSTYQVPLADFAGPDIANGWVMQFTVVPEPSTYALGLVGLVALACRAWAGRGRRPSLRIVD